LWSIGQPPELEGGLEGAEWSTGHDMVAGGSNGTEAIRFPTGAYFHPLQRLGETGLLLISPFDFKLYRLDKPHDSLPSSQRLC
jgi:hypothetical protein